MPFWKIRYHVEFHCEKYNSPASRRITAAAYRTMTAAPGIMTATDAEQPGQLGTQPAGQPASQAGSQAGSQASRVAQRGPGAAGAQK